MILVSENEKHVERIQDYSGELERLRLLMSTYNNLPASQRPSYLELPDNIEATLFSQFADTNELVPTNEAFAQLVPEWASSYDQINSADDYDCQNLYQDYYLDEPGIPTDKWHCPLKLVYVKHNWSTGEETAMLFDSFHERLLKHLRNKLDISTASKLR